MSVRAPYTWLETSYFLRAVWRPKWRSVSRTSGLWDLTWAISESRAGRKNGVQRAGHGTCLRGRAQAGGAIIISSFFLHDNHDPLRSPDFCKTKGKRLTSEVPLNTVADSPPRPPPSSATTYSWFQNEQIHKSSSFHSPSWNFNPAWTCLLMLETPQSFFPSSYTNKERKNF